MFVYHAHRFHGLNLALEELEKEKLKLENSTKMRYMLLHLYLYAFAIFSFSDLSASALGDLGVSSFMLINFILLTLPFVTAMIVTKDSALVTKSFIYPISTFVKNSVIKEIDEINRAIESKINNECELKIPAFSKKDIPSFSTVMASHYDHSVMERYLLAIFNKNSISISMKEYVRSMRDIAKKQINENPDVRLTKNNN